MTVIQAKPIIANKFWIVEQNGERIATLRKNEENFFVLSNESTVKRFKDKKALPKYLTFGIF